MLLHIIIVHHLSRLQKLFQKQMKESVIRIYTLRLQIMNQSCNIWSLRFSSLSETKAEKFGCVTIMKTAVQKRHYIQTFTIYSAMGTVMLQYISDLISMKALHRELTQIPEHLKAATYHRVPDWPGNGTAERLVLLQFKNFTTDLVAKCFWHYYKQRLYKGWIKIN